MHRPHSTYVKNVGQIFIFWISLLALTQGFQLPFMCFICTCHRLHQAGTIRGETSKPDLIQNSILKVHMLRFLHLNAVNQAWPHFHSLRPQKSSKIEGTNLGKNVQTRFAGLYNLCHPGLYKVHILFLCFKLLAPPSQYQIKARYSHCDIRVATTCISDAVFLQKMYII